MRTSLGPSLPSGRGCLSRLPSRRITNSQWLPTQPPRRGLVLPSTAHPVSRTATHVRDRSLNHCRYIRGCRACGLRCGAGGRQHRGGGAAVLPSPHPHLHLHVSCQLCSHCYVIGRWTTLSLCAPRAPARGSGWPCFFPMYIASLTLLWVADPQSRPHRPLLWCVQL